MKIEAGKYYRTRDGQRVGPMRENGVPTVYRWSVGFEGGAFWDDSGRGANARSPDLIAEWAESDLATITTPFGLLDEETQHALRDHGGPYEAFAQCGNFWRWQTGGYRSFETHQALAWRVKPKPETTEYVLYWSPGFAAYRSRFNPANHKIIITMEGDKLTGIRAEVPE